MKLAEVANQIDHGNKVLQNPPTVAYHLTPESRAQQILKTGLRPGRGNAQYQYTQAKIFLITDLSGNTLERVGSVVMTAGRTPEEMEDSNTVFEDVIVLEVNLQGFDGPIYQDTSQGLSTAVFVTQPIEASRIKMRGRLDFVDLMVK